MVRNVDYESRKRAVLAATINQYIKQALPVASEDIASDFSLSSATIRNIFVDLEGAGLLTHPYTSGGRVPTAKGYRYYVDFLIAQMQLLDEEKDSILKEYKREINRLEDILETTSEVISTFTHYASVVSILDWHDKLFYKGISFILEQPEFQDLVHTRFLIRMIEEKRRLLDIVNRDFKEKVKVYIGEELECPEMKNCSLVVSSYSMKKKPLGKLAVLGPTRMEYSHIIPTLEYVSDILSEVLDEI
jgi:transcriptional regulator of heat shock response